MQEVVTRLAAKDMPLLRLVLPAIHLIKRIGSSGKNGKRKRSLLCALAGARLFVGTGRLAVPSALRSNGVAI